jgi:CSLREA domain-containing protein
LSTLGLLAVLVLALLGLSVRPAAAAGITVTTDADNTIGGDGFCTLREAITNANNDSDTFGGDCAAGSGADTITFAADYTITLAGSQLPAVTSEITITGNGAANTIIQANAAPATADYRVFEVNSGGSLTLNSLTVRHGRCQSTCAIVGDSGGAIAVISSSFLALTDSVMSANRATTFGGAVYLFDSTAVVTRTTFTDNRSTGSSGSGGAILSVGSSLTVVDSTFNSNSAVVGGALYNSVNGTLSVSGSTFDRNEATTNFGGGVYNTAAVTVTNSTFSGNSAGAQGGGLANFESATVTNSTFSGNLTGFGAAGTGGVYSVSGTTVNIFNTVLVRGTGANCIRITAAADSVADDGSCAGATQRTTAEIALGPLQDNGGPTFTHALLPGSHAIDLSPTASCAAAPVNGLDQRGEPRNVDGDGAASVNECDAGAYEHPGAALTIVKATDPAGGTGFPFTVDPGTYNFDFKFGSNGIAPFQFREPADIAFDAAGNVYIADLSNYRIKKHQPDGTWITQIGVQGSGDGFFDPPWGIAVGPDGSVYVADGNNNRIQKFDSAFTFQMMWGWGVADGSAALQTCSLNCQAGASGNNNGQLNGPRGVAVDADGFVYVSDFGNNRVQKFTGAGVYVGQWGTSGSGNSEFNGPWGIAVDGAGQVFVADTNNNRIQKFDSNGAYITQWGTIGSGDGQFNFPVDVAVDAAGNAYVVDRFNQRIQKFTGDGVYLTQFGSGPGTADGQLNFPLGAGVNAAGQVYIADAFNDRIQVFSPDLATTLDDGEEDSFTLPPGNYLISELVPAGWTLEDIDCDTDSYSPNGATARVTLAAGDDVTCTFTNLRLQAPSFCPVDEADTLRTDLLGVGMGSPTMGARSRKLAVPNYQDVDALYGQLAAVDVGIMKYVRFLPQGSPTVQIHAPTSPAYRPAAVDWWGTDLPAARSVRGQFFWGQKGNRAPRAFVLWPTYRTAETYANVLAPFDESSENHVYWDTAGGWIDTQTQVLSIPPTQAAGASVTVNVAVVDVNKDARSVILTVEAGGVSETRVITVPNRKSSLNIETFTLAGVPAGTDEVTITLESPPPGEVYPFGGDSAAMIGASANYACEVPGP